ncbi:MAG: protein kinase [Deltaproteobacteria bacterium]|nr:protein kinase [Deltaproteobacteria bacterium]
MRPHAQPPVPVPAAVDEEGPTEFAISVKTLEEADAALRRAAAGAPARPQGSPPGGAPAAHAEGVETPQSLVGRTIDGRYRLDALRGVGGMGAVYLARHEAIERVVALKLLLPEFSRDPVTRERFYREARAVNRIRHPNVVEVLDLGRTDEDRLYMVQEFLDGESLQERLARGGLPPEETLRIARAACSGLGAAHDLAIIHRDVTPSNIFLVRRPGSQGEEPDVKVLDFGIALLKGEQRLTKTGQMLGTPCYLAPEIVLHKETTPATDIYSLGAVLYEALSGRAPFQADSVAELLVMHVSEKPRPLASACPGLPPSVNDLVMSCLEKRPEDRPQNMHELAGRIDSLLEAMATSSREEAAAVGRALTVEHDAFPAADALMLRVSTTSITAWKEFLQRASAWARRQRGDAGMKVAELEFAVNGIESAGLEARTLESRLAEQGVRDAAARERFDRALEALCTERDTLGGRIPGLEQAEDAVRKAHADARRSLVEARVRLVAADKGARGVRPIKAEPSGDDAAAYEALLDAYIGAGEAASRCRIAMHDHHHAQEAREAGQAELADVQFQLEQLEANRGEALAKLDADAREARVRIEALERRCAELYRKLIDAAAHIPIR